MILTNLETIMDLTNKETITKGTDMGVTTQEIIEIQENNPHGIVRGTISRTITKEILVNNLPGIAREVVTQ